MYITSDQRQSRQSCHGPSVRVETHAELASASLATSIYECHLISQHCSIAMSAPSTSSPELVAEDKISRRADSQTPKFKPNFKMLAQNQYSFRSKRRVADDDAPVCECRGGDLPGQDRRKCVTAEETRNDLCAVSASDRSE